MRAAVRAAAALPYQIRQPGGGGLQRWSMLPFRLSLLLQPRGAHPWGRRPPSHPGRCPGEPPWRARGWRVPRLPPPPRLRGASALGARRWRWCGASRSRCDCLERSGEEGSRDGAPELAPRLQLRFLQRGLGWGGGGWGGGVGGCGGGWMYRNRGEREGDLGRAG